MNGKEREIKNIIDTINDRNTKVNIKDKEIRDLKIKVKSLQNEAFMTERVVHGLREDIKKLNL